jgi:hypothetical protein
MLRDGSFITGGSVEFGCKPDNVRRVETLIKGRLAFYQHNWLVVRRHF